MYRTVILPVVLYGCKTWSLTLREECRLRVFENGVLRRIFGPKRDKGIGENCILRSSITKYFLDDQIEKNEMGGACGMYGEGRGIYRVLVGKPEGKRQLGRPRHRWEDNIKMEVGLGGGMDWVDLAEDGDRWWTLLNVVMNLRVP